MGNATSAGLGSEAPHDERNVRSAGSQNSDTRPDDIELAEEAKESKVISWKSILNSEVPRLPASYSSSSSCCYCCCSCSSCCSCSCCRCVAQVDEV